MPYIGNQHVAGDHVNNFKVLDDISTYTATFNGSSTNDVSAADDTIRVPDHRFIQGQRVTYNNGGGSNIGGLTSGTAYYVSFHTSNTIKLATSLINANSNSVINISAVGSGSSHTLNAAFDGVNTKFKLTHSGGKSARLNNATQINVAINNVIQRPNNSAVTFTEGFALEDNHKIAFKTAPTVNDIFWGSIIANTIENFDLQNNEIDNFTGDGSTTEFTLTTLPANNDNVVVSIDGVLQHPSDASTTRAYTLIANIIQFTAAPALNAEIQVRHIGFAGASTNDVSGFYGRTGNVALTANDHITTGDITARNFKATGITTFSGSVSTGAITATTGTFSGNVSIGGTLTYEDVTNIDSVGLVTARDGIFIPNNEKLEFSGSVGNSKIRIYQHAALGSMIEFTSSSTGYIGHNASGAGKSLTLNSGNDFIFKGLQSNGAIVNIARFYKTGQRCALNADGVEKFTTSSKGIQVGTGVTIETNGQATFAGITTFSGNIGISTDMQTNETSGAAVQRFWDTGTINAGNTYKLGRWAEGEAATQLLINVRSEVGGHSGTATYLWQGGYQSIGGYGQSRLFPLSSGNGHGDGPDNGLGTGGWVVLIKQGYYAYEVWVSIPSGKANKRLKVTVTELNRGNVFTDISETVANSTNNAGYHNSLKTTAIEKLYFKDNGYAYFGDSQDLKLYHNSGNSFIENSTGYLLVNSSGGDTVIRSNNDVYLQPASGEHAVKATANGSVDLYYDQNNHTTPKLKTTATGITVDGEVAASQDYPMVKPTLDCNFVLNKKLDPRIGYTRKGVASFYDEQGILKIVGDNVPRFDHNPETRESLGILIEEERTNNQPHSEQWSSEDNDLLNVVSGMDVDINPGVVTPTGETTGAITFMETGASGQHYIAFDVFGATVSGTSYTFSFFFKNISGGGSGNANNLKFISSTSAFSYVIRNFYFDGTDAGTSTGSDTTITKLPNGWWRGTFTATANNNFSSAAWTMDLRGLNGGAAYNNKIAIWGIQTETGAFPTSYIRTGNSDYGRTATRGVDFLQIQGQAFTDLYNPVESTILCSYQHTKEVATIDADLGGSRRVYRFGTGDTSSDTRIDFVSTSTFHPYISADGTNVATITATAPTRANVNTYATRVKENDFATTKAGGSIASDTSGSWDPVNKMIEVQIGGTLTGTSEAALQAHYKRFTYYPVGLPNSQLITISS